MLCLFALAPASPLVAAAAFFYFLFCVPMLRWTMIFLYKPKFDIGGKRFPFCFDMIVSAMIVGQILLLTMMTLRRAYGPAFAAFLPIIPTASYRWILRSRYLKAFDDAALLQTSLLDGWDTNEDSSLSRREEFRQFLVDCHKAAYVPVCIASSEGLMITSEPAVVVPIENDIDGDVDDDATSVNGESVSGYSHTIHSEHAGFAFVGTSERNPLYHSYNPEQQHGRMMRRANAAVISPQPYIETGKHIETGKQPSGHGVYSAIPMPGFSSPRPGSFKRSKLATLAGNLNPPYGINLSQDDTKGHSSFSSVGSPKTVSPQIKFLQASPSRTQKKFIQTVNKQKTTLSIPSIPDTPTM
jgi:hypothetical protein